VRIKVYNEKPHSVGRGGVSFPPQKPIEVSVTDYQYREIKACAHLRVTRLPDEEVALANEIGAGDDGQGSASTQTTGDGSEGDDEDQFVCPFCEDEGGNPKVFGSAQGLKNHVRAKHSNEYEDWLHGGDE